MNNSITKIKNTYAQRYEPENYTYFALQFWTVLLITTTVIMSAGVGFGVWQFVAPPSPTVASEIRNDGIIGFNNEKLSRIVEYFETRSALFEHLMSGQ